MVLGAQEMENKAGKAGLMTQMGKEMAQIRKDNDEVRITKDDIMWAEKSFRLPRKNIN